jgi:hypothetical protein
MRLASIIIVWDDYELLNLAADNMSPVVDQVIIIYSHRSNYGEVSIPPAYAFPGYALSFQWEPDLKRQPVDNERAKRNFGLQKARELGFTHFILSDSDEFYDQNEFVDEALRFHVEPDLQGLVCATQVYFRSPTLTIGLDVTLVPFIHKLTPIIQHKFNAQYPYAFERSGIRIDPTRQLNINSGVKWSPIVMQHMSYIRKDLKKKIRNSTARANIERSTTLIDDYKNAKPGAICRFYNATLKRVPNKFNIPEIIDDSL